MTPVPLASLRTAHRTVFRADEGAQGPGKNPIQNPIQNHGLAPWTGGPMRCLVWSNTPMLYPGAACETTARSGQGQPMSPKGAAAPDTGAPRTAVYRKSGEPVSRARLFHLVEIDPALLTLRATPYDGGVLDARDAMTLAALTPELDAQKQNAHKEAPISRELFSLAAHLHGGSIAWRNLGPAPTITPLVSPGIEGAPDAERRATSIVDQMIAAGRETIAADVAIHGVYVVDAEGAPARILQGWSDATIVIDKTVALNAMVQENVCATLHDDAIAQGRRLGFGDLMSLSRSAAEEAWVNDRLRPA